MSAITQIAITSSAINSDPDFRRVEGKGDGKVADAFYIYYKKGEGEPITGLAVTYDDKPPGDGFVRLETSLTKTAGKAVYLWYQLKGTGSPLIELKLITSDDNVVGPGFNRISEELNPEAAGAKEYLTYKTKAAQQKLDARDFKVGDLVDCVDTSNAWLVARIMAVDAKEDRVQIHYEGWDPRWDEWLSRRSPRIASHGSHTGGKWTGNRASREPWNFAADKENFATITKRVEAIVAIVEAKTKELAPKLAEAKDEKARAAVSASLALTAVVPRDEYTFLLQDNFRYVMNVLNAHLDDPRNQYPHTQHFLGLQVKLLVHALKFEAELHVALQNVLLLFMCADPAFQKYYAEYGRTHDDKVDLTPPYTYRIQFNPDDPRTLVSNLLVGTLNMFGLAGGYEAVRFRLHNADKFKDSFFTTAKLIQAITAGRNVLNPKWREPYILSLKLPELVQERLSKVTDEDLKTLDREQLGLLSTNVQNLLGMVLDSSKLVEFSEKSALTICLRLLNSGVLAKRLDGAAQLEASLLSLRPRDAAAAGAAVYGQAQPPPAQFLTAAYMVNWLTENKVLDILLARDSHEQVIKRSPPVLKFLAQQNALKPQHVSLLWSAGVGKTDAVVRIVYDTLADLSQELSEEHLDELFKKMLEKNIAEYRDFDLKFMRDFTVNAVNHTKPDKNKWYGLDIFWQILQSGEAVPSNISQLASNYLTNLLAQPQFNSQLVPYLEKCIKTLQNGAAGAVLQALRLAQLIVDVGAPEQATKGKHSKEEVITKLEKEHKLLASLITDTTRYRAEANKVLASAPTDAKAGASAAPADPVVGGHPHSAHVQVRFDFLDFLLVNTAGELRLDQKAVDTLWDVYVTNPLHPTDRARCLAWLARAIVKNDRKGKSILAGLSSYIFSQLLCNESKLAYSSMPPEGWACFETFFNQLNVMEDALLVNPRAPVVVINYGKLVGLEALWSIATKATNPEVARQASTALTTVHLRLDWALAAKDKKQIFKTFIDKCMANLKDGHQQLKKLRAADAKANDQGLVHRLSQVLSIMDEYLARMHNNELIARPRFAEGQKIVATWMQQTQKYHAEVKKVNRDGTYVVVYQDGDVDQFCPERNMYFVEGDKPKDSKNAAEDDYAGLSSTPRVLLSNEQPYFDLLFDLLGVGGDVARLVVKLLARLPINQGLSDTIKNLTTAASVDWNNLLPRDSVMKLSYTLKIVRNQVIPPPLPHVATGEGGAPDPTAAARQAAILAVYTKWSEMFLAKGGFQHLAGIFISTKIEDLVSTTLTQECMFHLLELINYFIGSPHLTKLANPYFEHEKALKHLLSAMEAIVQLKPSEVKAAAAPKAKGAAANPELEAEKQVHSHLVQYTLHCMLLCAIFKPALIESVIFTPATGSAWERILHAGLLSKSPYVRKAMDSGLRALCGFPQAHAALLPKLLAMIGQLDTMAHSAICSEYFDLCAAELKRPAPAPAAPASATAADAPASPTAVAVVPVTAAAAEKKGAPLYDAVKLVENLVDKIRKQPVLEPSPGYIDYLLCGLFQLTEQLVQQNPALKESLGKSGLISDVLLCLFEAPKGGRTPGVLPPPKCKNAKTRKDAYSLLAALADGCTANRQKIIEAVTPNHYLTHSGVARSDEWNFEARAEEKSQTGYLGLVNLACICYQNSNLQQLFMVPRFRANILSVDQYKEENLSENMVYQLQLLFGQLQESEKVAANPAGFVHTYKGDDGKPVDVRVQEDSGEFLRKVLDRLSTGLKGTKYANAVKDVFGGVLVNQKIGRGPCTHFKERDEEFFGVQIQVKDKKSLEEGLATFVAGDVMEGSEAVRCDACAKKVPVLMRQVFKRLPPTMIFVLKRFEMDYNTMDITKLNSRFTFPFKVNLRPYCQETLVLPKGHTPVDAAPASTAAPKPADGKSAEQSSKVAETSSTPTAAAAAVSNALSTALHPDEYYEYVLRGCVVHTGSAHGGHYYSFIQERLEGDQEGKWYEFNDTRVSPFNPDQLPEECFGGSEEVGAGRGMRVAAGSPSAVNYGGMGSDGAGGAGGYERSRNAYILYYDRVKPKIVDPAAAAAAAPATPASPSDAATSKLASSVASLKTMKQAAKVMQVVAKQRKVTRALRARAQLPPKMFKEIWQRNITHWRDRAVFDKAYFEFLWQVLDKVKPPEHKADAKPVLALPPKDEAAPEHVQAAILGTRFVLMTLAHSKEGKDYLPGFMSRLKRLYESDLSLCLWLLQEMFNPESMWACDFLLACPEEGVRNNVADVLCKILSLVSPLEQDALKPGAFETVNETVTTKAASGEVQTSTKPVQVGAGHAVRFINALITRLFNLTPSNWRTFDPYFRVLSHFAALGAAEAQFLVREHNLLARILDLYVSDKSSHPEVNQFTVDPKGRRVRVGEDYGRPTDLGHLMTLLKQLVCISAQPSFEAADGKDKPAAATAPASAADNKAAPAAPSAGAAAGGKQLLPLSRAANDLLLGSAKGEFLQRLLASAVSNRRGKVVSAIVTHLCTENQVISTLIGKIINQALLDNDYDGVRPYFRVMMTLVLLKDSLHTTRANALIESLVTVIHTQSRFWKITDFCFEHLLRMARKSRTVYTWLNGHQKYCENMIGWLHAYAEPPAPSFHRGLGGAGDDSQVILLKPQSEAPRVPARTGAEHLAALDLQMRAGQRGRGALYGGPDVDAGARNPYANGPTGLHPTKKMELLQLIKAGKELDGPNAAVTDAGNASDSDLDFSERTFKVGEYVDCADSVKKWLPAQIIRIEGNRVEVHYVGWADKWNETLDVADPRIMPIGTKTTAEQRAEAKIPVQPK